MRNIDEPSLHHSDTNPPWINPTYRTRLALPCPIAPINVKGNHVHLIAAPKELRVTWILKVGDHLLRVVNPFGLLPSKNSSCYFEKHTHWILWRFPHATKVHADWVHLCNDAWEFVPW